MRKNLRLALFVVLPALVLFGAYFLHIKGSLDYYELAAQEVNPELCAKITDEGISAECYYNLAHITGNDRLCKEIRRLDLRNNCREDLLADRRGGGISPGIRILIFVVMGVLFYALAFWRSKLPGIFSKVWLRIGKREVNGYLAMRIILPALFFTIPLLYLLFGTSPITSFGSYLLDSFGWLYGQFIFVIFVSLIIGTIMRRIYARVS